MRRCYRHWCRDSPAACGDNLGETGISLQPLEMIMLEQLQSVKDPMLEQVIIARRNYKLWRAHARSCLA